ncbi:MAG: hypothetical protein ILP08_01850 [Lachnospiraceae bacterium]|nr:hypothetical protein [Lachnospiraceae bacterium]MCR5212310.1 hypothetical protein [Lachnospiraceae bacterium]
MDMNMNYVAPIIAAGALAKDPDENKGKVSYYTKGKKKEKTKKDEKFAVVYELHEKDEFSPVTYSNPLMKH